MSGQLLIAITGPTGSGKTTLSAKLAGQIPKCVNIDADTIKHLIVNGFIYDSSEAGNEQWALLGDNIGQLAKNFHDKGYNVIINGYINEPAWENIEKYVEFSYKFLLLPAIDVVLQRDRNRDVDIRMGTEAVSTHNEYFSNSAYYSDFTKVDSTKLNADETIDTIKDYMK